MSVIHVLIIPHNQIMSAKAQIRIAFSHYSGAIFVAVSVDPNNSLFCTHNVFPARFAAFCNDN